MRFFSYLVGTVMIFGVALTSCGKHIPQYWLPESINILQHNAISDITNQSWHKFEYDSRNRIAEGTMGSSFSLKYDFDVYLAEYLSCYISSRCTRVKFSKNGNKITFVRTYHPTVSLFGTENGEIELNA